MVYTHENIQFSESVVKYKRYNCDLSFIVFRSANVCKKKPHFPFYAANINRLVLSSFKLSNWLPKAAKFFSIPVFHRPSDESRGSTATCRVRCAEANTIVLTGDRRDRHGRLHGLRQLRASGQQLKTSRHQSGTDFT